jgi:hypothetical protein
MLLSKPGVTVTTTTSILSSQDNVVAIGGTYTKSSLYSYTEKKEDQGE